MKNVNAEAVEATIETVRQDASAAIQRARFQGEWQMEPGAAQFCTDIPLPNGGSVRFEADYPPHMGGNGAAPNPLAYCFWGGLACFVMTYAQEAALRGVEITALRARVEADVDLSRALGVSDRPPVEGIDWYLEVESDASADLLAEIKADSDERCPGAYCISNPIELRTHLERAGVESAISK